MSVLKRGCTLPVGGVAVTLPCFFPSISSVKANLEPYDYLEVLCSAGYPLFLVSAYDIGNSSGGAHERILAALRQACDQNQVVLLDSGRYESYWLRDNSWTLDRFTKVLRTCSYHLAFCYDDQGPCKSVATIVQGIQKAVLRDQEASLCGTVIPIVHGIPSVLPEAVYEVAAALHPLFVAVPERELGDGVIARAECVWRIRRMLDRLGWYCPLHLLGTGNPLAILLYAACGADSFDGLEWCQTCVDHASGRLYHFHQWDFFAHQTAVGASEGIPYLQAVLLHNLLFYQKWMDIISRAIGCGALRTLLEDYLPSHVLGALRARLPGVF